MAKVFSFSPLFCSIKYSNPKTKSDLHTISSTPKTRHFQCLASKQLTSDSEKIITRQSANYKPSIWSYDFLQSLKDDPIVIAYFLSLLLLSSNYTKLIKFLLIKQAYFLKCKSLNRKKEKKKP